MAWDTQERLIKAENAEKILQEKLFKQESKATKVPSHYGIDNQTLSA
jgi:hypothetical protein